MRTSVLEAGCKAKVYRERSAPMWVVEGSTAATAVEQEFDEFLKQMSHEG